MVFPRASTPHPRRRVLMLLRATDVNAVPFSPRLSPPPSATTTPPPTPMLALLPTPQIYHPSTTTFDPLHTLASSSAGPATTAPSGDDGPYYLGDLLVEEKDKGKGVLGATPANKPPAIPKARDIRMVGAVASPTHPPVGAAAGGMTRSAWSPPSPASPAATPIL
ncbi:unnamed protein product [Urochloa humidicola]